jgi:hypothetical protein
MEKFGIFNILSALNTLTSGGASGQKEQKTEENKEMQQKNTNNSDTFNPPSYPMSSKPMLDVLARHDEISKRIDKNTRKK